jgi:hypothetical protein
MIESTDRLAWTQNRDNGMGDGFEAYKDKQPSHRTLRPLIKNYYESPKYTDMIKKGLEVAGTASA